MAVTFTGLHTLTGVSKIGQSGVSTPPASPVDFSGIWSFDGTNGATSGAGFDPDSGTYSFNSTSVVELSTAQSRFGATSLRSPNNVSTLGGNVTYDLTGSVGPLNFPLTVEFFGWGNAPTDGSQLLGITIGLFRDAASNVNEISFGMSQGFNDSIGITQAAGGNTNFQQPLLTPRAQWNHFAYTLADAGSNLDFVLYLNGTSVSSGQIFKTFSPQDVGGVRIGAFSSPVGAEAFIDELRITDGPLPYTANFTPPASPF